MLMQLACGEVIDNRVADCLQYARHAVIHCRPQINPLGCKIAVLRNLKNKVSGQLIEFLGSWIYSNSPSAQSSHVFITNSHNL